MKYAELLGQINDFEKHYQYNSTYMREMLESSVAAYDKFNKTMPLVGHRELLDAETYWVDKLPLRQYPLQESIKLLISCFIM